MILGGTSFSNPCPEMIVHYSGQGFVSEPGSEGMGLTLSPKVKLIEEVLCRLRYPGVAERVWLGLLGCFILGGLLAVFGEPFICKF